MLLKWKYTLPLVALCVHITVPDQSRDIYVYDECRAQEPLGIGSGKISDGAMWSSTNDNERPASRARLNDPTGVWTAGTQNAYQYLGVDLGARYFVTAVATQGRQGTDEYVKEYFLEYSDDRNTWRRYTNEYGIPEMFVGNDNGGKIVQNTLHYPIVAQYIRFNPQRWSMFISMRFEVYGCLFTPFVASFTETSYMQFDLSRQPAPSETDTLELRFKTNKPDGVVFYASGNQGDYIVIEMRRGYLYFRTDLGSTQTTRGRTEVIGGSLLDDHQWHDVVITREKKKLKVVVDRLVNEVETNGLFYRLDLDKYLYIGGVPNFNKEGIEVENNFVGCVENVNFNGAKLLEDVRDGTSAELKGGVISFSCGTSSSTPDTFPTTRSYLELSGRDDGDPVRVGFDFRIRDENGLLMSQDLEEAGSGVNVTLDNDGYVAYRVVSRTGQIIEDVIRNGDILSSSRGSADDLWYTFSIYIDTTKVNCIDCNVNISNIKVDIGALENLIQFY